MRNYLIYTYFFLTATLGFAGEPTKWDNNLSTEKNIAANAISLKDSADLSFLNPIAKNKSIILLGEAGHYELKTSTEKINIINYLQKKEFKSIALETIPFLTGYVFSNPEYKEKTKDWKIENIWAQVWTDQKTCKPLMDQINKREIKLLGIDGQLGMYDVSAAQILLAKYKKEFQLDIDWSKLYKFYITRLIFYLYPTYYKPISHQEEYKLMYMVNEISNYVRYVAAKKENTNDLKAMMQWIVNVKNAYPYTKNDSIAHSQGKIDTTFLVSNEKNRDEMMAKNIVWHSNQNTNEKFTVWCANYHGSKELSQLIVPSDSLRYFMTQSMGEYLDNSSISNKVYSLALTSKNVYENDNDGILESEIIKVTNDAPYAFIDFVPLRFENGYWNKSFNTNFMKRKDGKYLFSFDGVYYLRDQKLNDN